MHYINVIAVSNYFISKTTFWDSNPEVNFSKVEMNVLLRMFYKHFRTHIDLHRQETLYRLKTNFFHKILCCIEIYQRDILTSLRNHKN
jgi:hypothetical protein